jgi:hypothetical protein
MEDQHMSISPELFNSVRPPGVWVTIAKPETGEHDSRLVTLRVHPDGGRSVSVAVEVSRYAPEATILLAMSHALDYLASAQGKVTRETMLAVVDQAVREYVEPF